MGWMCSWVAIKGGEKDKILGPLNLLELGNDAEPGSRDPDVPASYFQHPNGWFILFSEDYEWVDRNRVLELSRLGLTLGCRFQDKVDGGSTTTFAAENGVALWRVAYNGREDKLTVSGNPPENFADIRDQIMREQEERDDGRYGWDIPLELAKSVCGYRTDQELSYFKGLKFTGPDAGLNIKHQQFSARGGLMSVALLPFRVIFDLLVLWPLRGPPKEPEL